VFPLQLIAKRLELEAHQPFCLLSADLLALGEGECGQTGIKFHRQATGRYSLISSIQDDEP